MKTILFPTDFSENANHVSAYAGLLAHNLEANVIIMNCYAVPMVTEYQIPYNINDFTEEMKEISEKHLKDFAEKFMKESGLSEDRISQRTEYGFVADVICEIAKDTNADMIVMGTQGASNILEKWIGTTAQMVVKQAECPVWVIPQKASPNYPQKFLYAADLLEDEIMATQKLMEFVKPFEANCKIIHIDDNFAINPVEETISKINELREEYKDDDNVFVKNIKRDDVVEGLETYIQSYKPDVLALAVHDKSFFSKIFEQSVTNHFVYHADLPMLIFRK